MTRKKGKSVNFDVIVKFFMQHYDLPTRADIDRVVKRLDHLERMLRSAASPGKNRRPAAGRKAKARLPVGKFAGTAAGQVMEVIGKFKQGAGLKEIQTGTGFDDKKIRNILYRLHKIGKIQRKGRGSYVIS